MKRLTPAVLAVLVWLAPARPVGADQTLVDGPPACVALGGEWDHASCRVHHLVIEAADTVIVETGVGLVLDGAAYNYGRLQTRGTFYQYGVFVNRGELVTEGLTVPSYLLTNAGTFVNRGWIHTHGEVENRGVLENEGRGIVETCSGPIVNHAYFHNGGALDNWGGLVSNDGVLVNDGSIYNPDAESYVFRNAGAVENRGSIVNGGTFQVPCGGALYGGGRFDGVPPAYGDCDAASAARLLAARVQDLGRPASGLLQKGNVIALVALLAPMAKGPNDLGAGGPLQVELFVEQVQALQARGLLPRHWAAALIGWAERLLVIPPVD